MTSAHDETTASKSEDAPCRFLPELSCPHSPSMVSLEECGACRLLEDIEDPSVLHRALRAYCRAMLDQEQRMHEEQVAFAGDFAGICEMLDRLCKGDPCARIEPKSGNAIVRKLAGMLNQLAGSLQEMIDESHEMAIGLCEHYDTLNRLSSGDLSARASVDSTNELVAKLGLLINREAEALLAMITELRRTDDELKTAYQRLQDIIEFLPDATFIVDSEKRIIAWNRAMEEMSGFGKDAMIGKGDHEYALPFYGRRCRALIDFIDDFHEGLSARYTYVEKKGETLFAENFLPDFRGGAGVYIWITASPLFDRNGNRVGAIESVRDITGLKRAEEEKASLETQLRQAQKMEAIGQLAGGIAHDFNNILAAIIGYGYLLQSKSGNEPSIQRYVSQMLAASEKATKLTKDLLAFSRKQIMNLAPENLNEVIGSIGGILTRLIGEDIELRIDCQGDPLMAMVDSGQIQQVVMNLVTNSRDAMPGGGDITIATSPCQPGAGLVKEHQAQPGRYAAITVRDTGVGMDRKTREKIFEPFFTTKETGKGTGLGLAIVYGIISQHNGFLDVKSAPGKGTTITAYLPIVENLSADADGEPQTLIPFDRGGSETILLAEDNADARQVYRDILEGAGYAVITAVDGNDAVDAFRQHAGEVRMVILDVVMPKKNGSQVLDEIRALRPEVRYLFSSGYTADIIQVKGKLEAGLHFLPKPALPNELLSRVREILDAETV